MKRIALKAFVLAFFCAGISKAAAQEADQVKGAVTALFTAMRNADAQGVRSAFTENPVLQSISVDRQTGKTVAKTEDVSAFADFVGKQAPGDADERIVFDSVKMDGDLASVWTPYQFYFKGKFSHCGVNSFQLLKVAGVWKIQYIIDTRRKDGCQWN